MRFLKVDAKSQDRMYYEEILDIFKTLITIMVQQMIEKN